MLVASRVAEALEARRESYRQSLSRGVRSRELYAEALDRLARLSSQEINERIGGVPWPGARPTGELDQRGLVVPFSKQWAHAQEARSWALERLRGITTVGVDGSQIAASREFAVPVGLVQAAWFENPHDAERQYVKDVRDELLLPDPSMEESDGFPFGDGNLNLRRFGLESEVVCDCIRRVATDNTPPAAPIVLFDGTFVLSFAGRMSPPTREAYLQSVIAMLAASAHARVPLVGYVDLSFASDLLAMVRTACDLDQTTPGFLFDAALLNERMEIFDRTAVFQCARGDILPLYRTQEIDYSQDLYFLYLKTGGEHLPSRIDIPRWVYDAGLVDQVVDVIRAEIVAGSGYPYALETADATAVLSTEDRLAFYRLWQQFARSEGIEALAPAKQASKLHRR